MNINGTFRSRVLAREFLAGTWLNLGSSVTAEMAGLADTTRRLVDGAGPTYSEEGTTLRPVSDAGGKAGGLAESVGLTARAAGGKAAGA